MKWFGDEPWAEATPLEDRVPRPTGAQCAWCGEEIELAHRGFQLPLQNGFYRAEHVECFMREVTGGPAHILGRCRCPLPVAMVRVEDVGEPPELPTLRAEALWVWNALGVRKTSLSAENGQPGRPDTQ